MKSKEGLVEKSQSNLKLAERGALISMVANLPAPIRC